MDLTVSPGQDIVVVLHMARVTAERAGSSQVTIAHLLHATAEMQNNSNSILQKLRRNNAPQPVRYMPGISTKKLEEIVNRPRNPVLHNDNGDVPLSDDVVLALQYAAFDANWMDHSELHIGHLVLGMARVPAGRMMMTVAGITDFPALETRIQKTLFTADDAVGGRQQMRYTRQAKIVISLAQSEAQELRHDEVNTAHLLIVMVQGYRGIATGVLRNLGIDAERIRGRLLQMMPSLNRGVDVLGLSHGYKRLLDRASNERRLRRHERLSTGHLLYHIALLDEDDVGVRALRRCGVSWQELLHTMDHYVQTQVPLMNGVTNAHLRLPDRLYTLTFEAQRNIDVALEEALRLQHRLIDTRHLLIGLMIDENSLTAHILTSHGADHRRVRALIEVAAVTDYQKQLNPLRMADDFCDAVQFAIDVACDACDYPVVNPLHLLAGLLMRPNAAALDILTQLSIDLAMLQRDITKHMERTR